jgi:hypothetical protein
MTGARYREKADYKAVRVEALRAFRSQRHVESGHHILGISHRRGFSGRQW